MSKAWFQGTADAVRQYMWLFEDAVREGIEDFLILAGAGRRPTCIAPWCSMLYELPIAVCLAHCRMGAASPSLCISCMREHAQAAYAFNFPLPHWIVWFLCCGRQATTCIA